MASYEYLPAVTLTLPMEMYPHMLELLTGSKTLLLDLTPGPMRCYVIRVTQCGGLVCEVTLRPTGAPLDLSPVNCRCAPAPILKEKPVKIKNRFYVASPSVTKPAEQTDANTVPTELAVQPSDVGRNKKWTRNSLKDAVDHATAMLDADPKLEHVAISRIVTLVRRKKAPVVVEHVK